jgi:hypothetical protein
VALPYICREDQPFLYNHTSAKLGTTYYLDTAPLNALAAEASCMQLGGHLVSYGSAQEQREVEAAFVKQGGLIPGYHESYWIGLQASPYPEFSWLDRWAALAPAAAAWPRPPAPRSALGARRAACHARRPDPSPPLAPAAQDPGPPWWQGLRPLGGGAARARGGAQLLRRRQLQPGLRHQHSDAVDVGLAVGGLHAAGRLHLQVGALGAPLLLEANALPGRHPTQLTTCC